MIISTIKTKTSIKYICKCDLVGCENIITRVGCKLEKVQYCCVQHRQKAVELKSIERKKLLANRSRIMLSGRRDGNHCVVCGKLKDDTFYDKSSYRPICSKEHYDIYFDSLPHRSVEQTPVENTTYTFYKQGRVIDREIISMDYLNWIKACYGV